MSHVPTDLRYTDDHEWIRTASDGIAVVGITDHAQKTLGDIVFLELPEPGRRVDQGEAVGTVESVKAVSEIFSPLAGEIVEINTEAVESPEDVNSDPYGIWIFKIRVAKGAASSDGLLDAKAYEKLVGGE